MKNIKYLLILFLLGIASVVIGQEQVEYYDVVYTNGGNVFRGKIKEYQVDGFCKLILLSGTEINLNKSQIRKIVSEPIKYKKEKAKGTRKNYEFKEKGFYNFSSFNISMSNDAFRNGLTYGAGIHHVSGYQFNRWIGLGLGIGMDYYYPGSGETFTPIYAELRGYTAAKNFSPMYSIAAGYGFTTTNENANIVETKGGYMLHPSFGFRMGGNPNANFTLDFGIKMQRGTFTYDWGWEIRKQRMLYKRFIIRTGILF